MDKAKDNTFLDHAGSNGEQMTQIGHIASEHQQCLVIVPINTSNWPLDSTEGPWAGRRGPWAGWRGP